MSIPQLPAQAPTATTTSDAPAAAEPTQTAADPKQSLKGKYANWPTEGDKREQPWDHQALGTSATERDELIAKPGSPNTISPIVIGHSMPILSSGSGGDQAWAINDLARRLKILGIDTSISQGRNPFSTLDQSVMSGVERFREQYNIQEDPTPWGGNTAASRDRANAHVGPWTWEALIRASDRAAD